jgi:ABC-2 type transport system permease protein
MRLFAEERKAGTLELLLTAPVRESQVVLAKYLASMAVVLAMIALTGAYGIVLGMFGSPDWGPIYGGYVGLVLLASTLVALGLTISALTSNQVVAAIVTIGISFLLWTIDTLAAMMPEGLERVLISFSLLAHFTPFAAGAMYTSDLGFFVSTTLLALFLAMRALARR